MLVRITSAAAVIALLAHSLLGCCWHHAHGDCADHELACLQAGAVGGRHHADHRESADAGPAGPQHDDEDSEHRHRTPCVEPNCSFVGADTPQLIDVPLICTAESISGTAVAATAGAVETGFSTRIDRASLSTARMRAALQTWVV